MRRVIVSALFFACAVCPLAGQALVFVNPGQIDIVNAATNAPAMTSTEGLAAGSLFRVRTFGLYYSGDLTTDDSISLRFRTPDGERDLTMLSAPTSTGGAFTALLPEDIALGEGEIVVVAKSGKSFARHVWIVPAAFGLFSGAQNSTGSGPPVRNQLTAPTLPGGFINLRGTGLGRMTASDVEIDILGVRVRADSAGRLLVVNTAGVVVGQTGVDQITFRFPEDVPDDCYIPITVRVANRASNQITIAKAEGPGPCRHPLGLSAGQLQALDRDDSVSVSSFSIESDVIQNSGVARDYIRLDTLHFGIDSMQADGVAAVSGARDADNPFSACSISNSVFFPDSYFIGVGVSLTSEPAVRFPDGQELGLEGGFVQTRVSVPDGSPPGVAPPSAFQGGDWSLRLPGSTVFDTSFSAPPPLRWTNRPDLQVISPQKELMILWEPRGYSGRERVTVKLSTLTFASTGWKSVSLGCRAPAAEGSITVPAALISQFADQAGNKAQLEVLLDQSNRERSTYSIGGTIPGVVNVSYREQLQTRIE